MRIRTAVEFVGTLIVAQHADAQSYSDPAGSGAVPDEAPWAARRRFGNITRYTEETRDMSGLGFVDMLRQDVRFAFRTFRHSKGFTAIAIISPVCGFIIIPPAIFGLHCCVYSTSVRSSSASTLGSIEVTTFPVAGSPANAFLAAPNNSTKKFE